jgi:hypothetical protein
MRKRITIAALVLTLVVVWLASAGPVASQVGPDNLKYCRELAFSTEEDFVTQGPEPSDGNPIISDGDLLGITQGATGGSSCMVCARNADLLSKFDVNPDLGLDAADVIDVDLYLVAFSTELDSSNTGQFTAGDLLVTNGVIILNQALTQLWRIPYDIGLDAVHFLGDPQDIVGFLEDAGTVQEPIDAGLLAELFSAHETVDILFSTEGTWGPVLTPVFLDGDLLSARTGLVAKNADLLDLNVPAGIPDRGVDFGLDAVTTARIGDPEELLGRTHFSTEILHENRVSFTDGDVLRFGDGVVVTNWDLIQCFEPKAKFLGLDALSAGIPEEPGCVSRITDIGGVDIADISPTDGMAYPSTVGSIDAPVPFGGWIDISGTICDDVTRFRVLYRLVGSGNPGEPIPVLDTPATDWTVQADAFFPPFPDCFGDQDWYSDGDGWYDAADYRHLTEAALGGCNPGLALTVWESSAVPAGLGGPEALHEVWLETDTTAGIVSGPAQLVQLDNTAPTAELEKPRDRCEVFDETDMPLMIRGRILDEHFHSYRLRLTGDSYGYYNYGQVAYYDLVADTLIETGTVNWDVYQDLHEVSVFDLDASPMACGYMVELTAWDRTLVCTFKFTTNQAYHCPGCRHSGDPWTFKYEPTSP